MNTQKLKTMEIIKERFGWINGCFDILHPGHLELFRAADDVCHKLIVGIDSDSRIRERKGREPIFNQSERAEILSAIWNVDYILTFNTNDELRQLIKDSKANVIIVGKEYEGKVIGQELVERIVYVPRIKQISTTKIIEKCRTME